MVCKPVGNFSVDTGIKARTGHRSRGDAKAWQCIFSNKHSSRKDPAIIGRERVGSTRLYDGAYAEIGVIIAESSEITVGRKVEIVITVVIPNEGVGIGPQLRDDPTGRNTFRVRYTESHTVTGCSLSGVVRKSTVCLYVSIVDMQSLTNFRYSFAMPFDTVDRKSVV